MRRPTVLCATAAIAVLGLLAGTGCTPASSVIVAGGPQPDTVTAIGIGTGAAAPDQVTITFGVSARAKTGAAAMNSCTAATNRIVDALKAAGVQQDEVQTLQVSLYPIRDNSGRRVVGYQATQSIRVTTKKVDKAGDITAAATNAGASEVSGPAYTMTSENAARADSIAKAVADAKARASSMAKASGRKLGAALSVSEQTAAASKSPYFDAGMGSVYALSAAAPTPSLPGKNDVQTQVSVVFALE